MLINMRNILKLWKGEENYMNNVDETVAALLLILDAYTKGMINDATMNNVVKKYAKVIASNPQLEGLAIFFEKVLSFVHLTRYKLSIGNWRLCDDIY